MLTFLFCQINRSFGTFLHTVITAEAFLCIDQMCFLFLSGNRIMVAGSFTCSASDTFFRINNRIFSSSYILDYICNFNQTAQVTVLPVV